ncbi:ERI2 exoribonuclease, partial [Polyodon spathula]|nr:ERI2 exoribonuclease [Polyodon spathula]
MARSSKQEQAGNGDTVPSASKIKKLGTDALQTTLQAPRQQASATGCQYRSLVSPKTLLNGLSAPGAWGRLAQPVTTPQAQARGSPVTAESPSLSTRSLVLVATTVDSVTSISRARFSMGGGTGARSSGSIAFKAPAAAAAAKSTAGANRARINPPSSSSFSTARPRPLGDKEASLCSRSGLSSGGLVLSATVNWTSLPPSHVGKVTPPLCQCGRRAKKLSVSNGGPNHGKGFYCCPVGKRGCGYFKWESVLLKEKSRASFSPSGSLASFQSSNLALRPSLRS